MSEADTMFTIAFGSLNAMNMIAEKGFKGLNPKTHRFQIIDKDAIYKVSNEGNLYYLKCNKDLVKIAEEKGLIL